MLMLFDSEKNYVRRRCRNCGARNTYDPSGLCCGCRPRRGRIVCPVCKNHTCKEENGICRACRDRLRAEERKISNQDALIRQKATELIILKMRKAGESLPNIAETCKMSVDAVYGKYMDLLTDDQC